MNRPFKLLALAAVLVLLLAGASALYKGLRESNAPPEAPVVPLETPPTDAPGDPERPGRLLIDVKLQDEAGQEVSLLSLTGKPMVLHFWATWCGVCKEEMPTFQKVSEELGDEVTFVMVDLTDGAQETPEMGLAYRNDNGYTFPIYFDTDQEAAQVYGITALPTTIFVDADGYGLFGRRGSLSEEELLRGIDLAKKGELPAPSDANG